VVMRDRLSEQRREVLHMAFILGWSSSPVNEERTY
jgi:hypothetical protein